MRETHLAKLVDSGSTNLWEERVEGLLDEETQGANHGDAAVSELSFAAEHQLGRRQILGEAERVEEAKGASDTRKVLGLDLHLGRRRAHHGRE